MNSLLRSDFEEVDKNFIKKLRRIIIRQILFIRKRTYVYDYMTIYNFSYFNILFSVLFLFLPLISFVFKINNLNKNEKSNFLENFLLAKLSFNNQRFNFLVKNETILKKSFEYKYYSTSNFEEISKEIKIENFTVLNQMIPINSSCNIFLLLYYSTIVLL
jgi:hypothetical protein